MTNAFTFIARAAKQSALAGFLAGGVFAAWDILQKPHVREFQAGEASAFLERSGAIAQRAALEGLGFGLLAAVIAILAWVVGHVLKPLLAPRGNAAVNAAQTSASAFFHASAAFLIWITLGSWLGNEFVAFLDVKSSLLLSAGGFFVTFIGILIFGIIAQKLPSAGREEPAATGLASAIVVCLVAWLASTLLLGSGGALRNPVRLGVTGLAVIIAFPAAAILGAVLQGFVRGPGLAIASSRALPKFVYLTIFGLLGICTVVGFLQFDLSAAPSKIEYASLPPRGKPAGPNVILITIDTLRADHLGCYGYSRPTSPWLDSLAANGTRFADASAAAPWTKPSTATILTGLFPSRHGALYHGSTLETPENKKTLAETFQEKGYVTAGFVSNPNVKKIFKFNRGFDEFFDSPVEDTITQASFRDSIFGNILKELTRFQFNWKYQNDCMEINRHVFSWLEKNHSEKFFLYLHYIDPHEPYSPPADYEKQFAQNRGLVLHNERKRQVGIDLYDGEIRYTDDNLKVLEDRLRAAGVLENTIIAVTADHGEEFFEHGALGHGFSLYQEVVHVPLLMRGPGVAKGAVVNTPVNLVDLAATVLDAAATGINEIGDGKSFANLMRDPKFKSREKLFLEDEFGENENDIRSFVLSGLRMGPWKIVLNERNAYRPPEDPRYGREELYNLDSDPGEKKNLFHDEKNREIITKLLDDMLTHAKFLSEKGLRKIKPPALSPEVADELRRIGYLK